MNMVSKLTAGAAVAIAMIAGPALADGYTAPKKGGYAAPAGPVCDAAKFGGAFVGIHGGFGTLTSTVTDVDGFNVAALSNQQANDGIVIGGQIGYNFARCNTIFGIEADFSWSNIDETRNFAFGAATATNSLNWLSSIRTKAGVAVGDLFIYATGGIAFANIESSSVIGGNFEVFKSEDTRFGWVAGLGTEYALSDRVRLTGDVMYYDFGTNTTLDTNFQAFRFDDHHSLWVTRIGLNFKLGHEDAGYHAMK